MATLPLPVTEWLITTPKRPQISTFCVAFRIFVSDNRRNFKFQHSKSQPTDHKPSLKWASSRHMILFKF